MTVWHDRAVAGDGWFAGAEGRGAHEVAFLARLRADAPDVLGELVAPEATEAVPGMAPAFVRLDVPHLTSPRRELQLGFWTSPACATSAERPTLQGAWSDHYHGDDYAADDPECLTVVGVDATPEQHARWALAWMRRQLDRPVVREEWTRGARTVATRWVLDDTGAPLGSRGMVRLRRRPADRRTRER